MNNVEIIEQNQTLKNVERVDFGNPTSILNYGSELLNQMGNLIQNLSKVMKTEDSIDGKLIKKIQDLEEFEFSLEKVGTNNKKTIIPFLDGIKDKIPF